MAKKKIEEAEFQEVKEVVQEPVQDTTQVGYNALGMVENSRDDEDEDESSSSEDLQKLNNLSEQYRKTEVEQTQMFMNPETGEMVERSKLPPLEQIRVTAKSTGHHINDPKKNCKKCFGRGYTAIKLEGTPIPCDCIFEEFYKANPESKKTAQNYNPPMNRKQKRMYEKQYKKYVSNIIEEEVKKQMIIQKSKSNLRKNTPVTETEPVVIETAEGVI